MYEGEEEKELLLQHEWMTRVPSGHVYPVDVVLHNYTILECTTKKRITRTDNKACSDQQDHCAFQVYYACHIVDIENLLTPASATWQHK